MGWSQKLNDCNKENETLKRRINDQVLSIQKLSGKLEILEKLNAKNIKDRTNYVEKIVVQRTDLKNEIKVLEANVADLIKSNADTINERSRLVKMMKDQSEYDAGENEKTISTFVGKVDDLTGELEKETNSKKLYRYATLFFGCAVTGIVLALIFS